MKFVAFSSILLAVTILAWDPMQDSEMKAIRLKCRDDLNITNAVFKTLKFDDPEDFLALNYTYCKVLNYGYFVPGKGLDCHRIAEQAHEESITTEKVYTGIKNCCLDKNPHRVSVQLWAARMFTCVESKKIYKKAIRSKTAFDRMVKREKEIHEYVLKLRKEFEELQIRRREAKKRKNKSTVKPKVNKKVKPTVNKKVKPTVSTTVKSTVNTTVKTTVNTTVKPTVKPTVITTTLLAETSSNSDY